MTTVVPASLSANVASLVSVAVATVVASSLGTKVASLVTAAVATAADAWWLLQ